MRMENKNWWDEKFWEVLLILSFPFCFVIMAVVSFVFCEDTQAVRAQVNERLDQIEMRLEALEQEIQFNE